MSRNSPSQRLNKYCRQAPRKSTAPSLAGVWTEPLSVSTQVRNVNKYFTKFIKLKVDKEICDATELLGEGLKHGTFTRVQKYKGGYYRCGYSDDIMMI